MKNETVKTGMKIGAVVGGILFLVFGVMAGFYFGSYGTLFILQKLMGGTVGIHSIGPEGDEGSEGFGKGVIRPEVRRTAKAAGNIPTAFSFTVLTCFTE
jgi:hypothetical protein